MVAHNLNKKHSKKLVSLCLVSQFLLNQIILNGRTNENPLNMKSFNGFFYRHYPN